MYENEPKYFRFRLMKCYGAKDQAMFLYAHLILLFSSDIGGELTSDVWSRLKKLISYENISSWTQDVHLRSR